MGVRLWAKWVWVFDVWSVCLCVFVCVCVSLCVYVLDSTIPYMVQFRARFWLSETHAHTDTDIMQS